MTTVEENIAIVRGMLEAFNTRAFDRAVEYVAPALVRHDLTGAYPGVNAANLADFAAELIGGAPDLQVIEHDVVAGGDRVAARITMEGTHEGLLFGREATGRRFTVNEMAIYRLEDGKIAETWQLMDIAGFMSQIGG